MNYIQETESPSILLKGLIKKRTVNFQIESWFARIKRQLLATNLIEKMIYHLAILLSECEKRDKRLLSNISLDTIYVKANDSNDPHVFIAEEDQQFVNSQQTALKVLKKIIRQIGTDDYCNKQTGSVEDIVTNLLIKIFKIPQDRGKRLIQTQNLLEDVYNLTIVNEVYKQKNSLVFIVKTPYYINCERDIIALKWTQSSGEELDQLYEYREINLMEKIVDCKNCAKLYGYSKINLECIFFLRYYDITLDKLANKLAQNQQVTQKQFTHLFTQIALAINDLHSKGIIHRDLKPENIMFEYNQQNESIENMTCVLIDFDRSKGTSTVNDQGKMSDYQGTVAFQPPEGTQVQYDASYDIWQLGFIMLCILLRKKCTKYSQTYKPIETENEYREIINPFFNSAKQNFSKWCPLISQMIEYEKEKRPALKEVIEALSKLSIE